MTETDQTMLRDAFEVIHQSTQLVKDAELAGDLQQREADENGPAKKRKKVTKTPDDLRDERLQKQADLLWQLRSGFAKWLSKDQWCRLLETNGLDVPQGGPDKILDLLTDAALFGRPLRCEKCLQGQLFYSTSSQTYLCTGHLSEWTKCTVAARKPKRLPFGVPKDLSAEIPWLIDEAPLNELSERYYNDKQEEIVSSKRTYRNRASTGGADLEAGDKIRGRADVGKAYIKKGTTVDAEFEKAAISHVCKDDEGNLYSAALVEADMATGRNSYYKLQLLKHDTANIFWVFRSWGRIGTTQGGIKTEEFRSMKAGVAGFEAVFLEKTQNEWRDRKYFRKKAGGMNWIETDTSDAANVEGNVIPGSKTDLPKPIVEIMKMIFDVSTMQAALKEYNIDTEKMPLGKLSKSQITKAYTVLQELLELISGKGAARKDEILDASNRFYTIIPHNTQLKMLDNPSVIKKKTAMLDSLLEIIEAFAMVKNNPNDEEENAERDPVDVNYEKLKTKMTVLDKSSAEYKMLVDYAKKTHGQTHKQLKVDIIDIIKIEREGEEAKFKKQVGNRMLLWHGSGTPNYGGILSQGLRIAPPEAPVSGYMFGKGVYFADMFSKSANYCRAHNGEGLLLLADVALGKIKEEPVSITHTAATMTKNKTNSCRGIGGTIPDPSTHVNDASGYVIPVGKPIARETTRDGKPQMPSLLYNEYIVYDVDQICLRYLVRGAFR
ncbi:unnamed protein product, partial [Mesorhabditis belari]|uniref:Poly [ADP-ribose] polymerase n=1 Tax=Mesorhabditis belari TaxID=2138241 RepID=A0AAF3FMA9_9BILA